jgi:phosphoglucomutase
VHPRAGQLPAPDSLVDPAVLERDYYARRPDPSNAGQAVAFGTSGHRGSPLDGTFTESHILAITQAIAEYRRSHGTDGPLFLGKDTHAVSRPAERTALQVLAANGVETVIAPDDGYLPTPVISRAIVVHNRGGAGARADGIIITPSHNPPADGGIKYNPSTGGPADTAVTGWIQDRANALLRGGNREVRRVSLETALRAPTTHRQDIVSAYVEALEQAVDLEAVRVAGLRLGVDPMGGAAVDCWGRVGEQFGLQLTMVDATVDPRFGFMPLDHDGKIRMDCSSPSAMARLLALRDRFDLAVGTDPDADRHGIVTRSGGLLSPNHYLAVAIDYLLGRRPGWPMAAAVGKTLVSSGIIDRVVTAAGRRVVEVPVGFKWFTAGLLDGTLCFGGEESAGAAFLQHDGAAWTTDKDGVLLGLLAAELTARTGRDPGEHYRSLEDRFGASYYTRVDAPATPEQRGRLARLDASAVAADQLAGERIEAKLTRAPGNDAPIGGLKVVAPNGWFAARPSGTEPIYKLYAESFVSGDHLRAIVEQGREIVARALEVPAT